MRYGIPVTSGVLDPHFGHCEAFALIDVDPAKKTILKKEIMASPGHQPGFLPGWLANQKVEIVLAGGMGGRAIELFNERGVQVVTGAQAMNPETAVLEHMRGNLKSTGSVCEEHRHGC